MAHEFTDASFKSEVLDSDKLTVMYAASPRSYFSKTANWWTK